MANLLKSSTFDYIALSVVFFLISNLSTITCWSKHGHEAIGMITMSAVGSQTLNQVKRLLGGKDIADIADWAHKVSDRFPELKPLHYMFNTNSSACDTITIDEKTCPDSYCLIRALQYFYLRLTGKTSSNTKTISLTFPNSITFTDADILRYFVTLMGDLHQPLHCGFIADLGGKTISLVKREYNGKLVNTTLFDYWDNDVIQLVLKHNSGFWYGGWTHATSLGGTLSRLHDEVEAEKDKLLLFEKWGRESSSKACELAYKWTLTKTPIVSGQEILASTDDLVFEYIKQQLLIAGARLAFVLDSIFRNRDISRLRQGSAIQLVLNKEPVQSSQSYGNVYIRSFLINLSIISVVLSILFYAVRHYNTAPLIMTTHPFSLKPPKKSPFYAVKQTEKHS